MYNAEGICQRVPQDVHRMVSTESKLEVYALDLTADGTFVDFGRYLNGNLSFTRVANSVEIFYTERRRRSENKKVWF